MNYDFTTVIAVDAKYVEQLTWSAATWEAFRPEIFERPMLVVVDRAADLQISKLPPQITKHKRVKFVTWPDAEPATPFVSQRERMLSAFVHAAPRHVTTPWWLKVDTDAIGLSHCCWFEKKWLEESSGYVMIAPGWGYTKPAGQMAALDTWANSHPVLSQWPALNLPFDPNGKRCFHSRICSWVSFYRTDWTRHAASLCEYPRIPVPSQDGFHWYVAARQQQTDKILRVNFKRLGWTNIPKTRKLKETVETVFRTLEKK